MIVYISFLIVCMCWCVCIILSNLIGRKIIIISYSVFLPTVLSYFPTSSVDIQGFQEEKPAPSISPVCLSSLIMTSCGRVLSFVLKTNHKINVVLTLFFNLYFFNKFNIFKQFFSLAEKTKWNSLLLGKSANGMSKTELRLPSQQRSLRWWTVPTSKQKWDWFWL